MTTSKTIQSAAREIFYAVREQGGTDEMLAAYDMTREDVRWLRECDMGEQATVIAVESAVRGGPLTWDALETE